MTLYPIATGNFKLDGGAMFGVVPKALWERTNPADTQNRIDIAARCLLVEDSNRLTLIDTGVGNKQDEKFFGHYGLWGDHSLEGSLKKAGFHPDDITDVLLTHLHFDHCGGAILRNANGLLIPAFKNATFWVHAHHWQWATQPNKREKASFLPENILPMQESGQLKFITGEGPFLKDTSLGFDLLLVNGHTEKQMLPMLSYQGQKLVFAADLIPTTGHIPLPYIMGYDTRPLLTLQEKESFLNQAVAEGILLFMEHDAHHEIVSLKQTDRGVRMDKSFTFESLFKT